MTPFVRRLTFLALIAACLAALGALTTAPAAASHGRLSATRTPGGPVLAGSTVTVTATIENADPALELLDATLGVPLDPVLSPYATLVTGSVTARWREQDAPIAGTITSGNGPGDTRVGVHVDYLPAGQHIDVTFRVAVASRLPAGADTTTVQIFLTYNDGAAQSIPWYLPIPILAEPDLALTKTDFGESFQVPGPSGVTYSLVASNQGTQDATGVVLTDAVPLGTHFDPAASAPGWSCSPDTAAGSVCTLDLGDLAAGQSRGFAFRAVFEATSVPAGLDQVRNTGRVRDDGTNSNDPGVPLQAFAFETTPVAAAPDLVLAKTDGGLSAAAGDRVVYTLSYANTGTQGATGVVLHETVPENTTFDAAASDGAWTCGVSPSGIGGVGAAEAACTLPVGGLAAGATGTATFAVTTASTLPAGAGELVNEATLTDDGANGSDLSPGDNRARDTTPLLASPDLSLSKVDGGVTAHPGEHLAYGLSVRNNGTQDATGLVVQETVPDHTRFEPAGSDAAWTCTGGGGAGSTCTARLAGLAAGASRSLAFSVSLPASIPAGVAELVNTATVHDDGINGPDPTPGDNSATEPTPVDAAPDLAVTKDDGGVTARPGDTVLYTLTYRNRGDQDATGVVLHETLPAATTFAAGGSDSRWACAPAAPGATTSATTCTLELGGLGAGTSGTVRLAVTVPASVPVDLAELVNAATIADDGSNGPDPDPSDNASTETTPVDAAPALSLSKSDGGSTARPGETLVYSLAFANQGDRDAAGTVLEETVPLHTTFEPGISDPAWTCAPSSGTSGSLCSLAVGPLAAGTSGLAVFAVTVDPSLPAGVTHLVNRAVLRDGSGHDDTAEETTPVDASPVLSLAKSDGDAIAGAGDVLTYTLSYGNTGDQDAAGVVLEETVPENTTFAGSSSDPAWVCTPSAGPAGSPCTLDVGALPAGGSGTARFAVAVDEPLPPLDTGLDHLVNTASLQDGAGHRAAAEETTPLRRPAGTVDLALVKSDGGVAAHPGDLLVYRLTVRNAGDRAASGVVVEETVPENTAFSPEHSDAAWTCTPALAFASGTSPGTGESLGESLKAERIQNTGSGRLLVRSAGRSSGPSPATPAASTAFPAGSVCTAAPTAVTAITAVTAAGTPGTLAPGESAELAFAVTVAQDLPADTTSLLNRATVRDDGAAGPDADPSNNQATATTPVETVPPGPGTDGPMLAASLSDALAEDRDGSGGVSAGDLLAYSVRITNAGPGPAEEVVFDVPALDFLTARPGSVRGASARALPPGDSSLRVALGDLPAGASTAFAWDAEIDGVLPPPLRYLRAQGQVSARAAAARPSDDPDTPAPNDPTLTPLASFGGPPDPADPVGVPSLSAWGLLLLALALSLTAWRVLR